MIGATPVLLHGVNKENSVLNVQVSLAWQVTAYTRGNFTPTLELSVESLMI